MCGAPRGNQFWKLRSKHGVDKLFTTPQLLWEAACEYFEWAEKNPLKETKAFAFQGKITTKELPVMRAMTLSQLCFYLHVNDAYFRTFKSQLPEGEKDFNTVIYDIEQTIYNQKFQGASGNLLNANIISRELGLVDKQEVKQEITDHKMVVEVVQVKTPIASDENDVQIEK
jgi:hypothetical protein